jgi:hypothetical protein
MVVTGILDLELPLKKDARLSKDGINVVVDGVKDVDESYDYKFGITWDHGLNEDEKQEFDRIFQPDTKQEDAVRSLIKLSDRLTAYTIVDMAYTTDECNGISSKQTWRTSGYFCARNIRGEIRVPKGVDCRALLKLGRVRFVNVAFEIELKCSDKK